jgi:mono/diheme cytochrome c family protein
MMKSSIKVLISALLASQVLLAGAARISSDALLKQAPQKALEQKNPYAGNNEARVAGKKLFMRHCAECHGEDGRGSEDAPTLQSDTVRSASPGALVWFLKNGNLRRGMPSWSRLPEAQLWQIVTHLQD